MFRWFLNSAVVTSNNLVSLVYLWSVWCVLIVETVGMFQQYDRLDHGEYHSIHITSYIIVVNTAKTRQKVCNGASKNWGVGVGVYQVKQLQIGLNDLPVPVYDETSFPEKVTQNYLYLCICWTSKLCFIRAFILLINLDKNASITT